MFAVVAVNFEAFQTLTKPADRWLLICLLRYADKDGRCWPSLKRLGADAGYTLTKTSRQMAVLEQFGCFTRARRPGAGYVYQIAERFLAPRTPWQPVPSEGGGGVPPAPFRFPRTARGVAPTRNRKNPTKESKKERESAGANSLSGDAIPKGWQEAAAAERQRAGFAEVNLAAEWRKHVLWHANQGRQVGLGGWLLWAVRTRLDHTNTPSAQPEQPRQRIENFGVSPEDWPVRMLGWRHPQPGRKPFWLLAWGPPPGEPGCRVPAQYL